MKLRRVLPDFKRISNPKMNSTLFVSTCKRQIDKKVPVQVKRGLVQKSVVLPHKLTTFKVKVSFVYSLSQEKTTIGFISFCTLFRDGGKLIRFTKKRATYQRTVERVVP